MVVETEGEAGDGVGAAEGGPEGVAFEDDGAVGDVAEDGGTGA